MSKLKPCPFCGYDPIVYEPTGRIECCAATCGVNPFSHSVASWNNRTENEHLRLKEEECKELARDKKELVEALSALFNDYKQLADSGDAGNWRLEDQEVGKLALSVLEKHQC